MLTGSGPVALRMKEAGWGLGLGVSLRLEWDQPSINRMDRDGAGGCQRKPRCYYQEKDNGCRTGRDRCQLLWWDRVEKTVARESGNWDFSSSVSAPSGFKSWLHYFLVLHGDDGAPAWSVTGIVHMGYGRRSQLNGS